jgi:pilus assembly protein CpaF
MVNQLLGLQNAFVFDFAAAVDINGRFRGKAIPTGVRPRFTDRFNDRGIVRHGPGSRRTGAAPR